MKLIFTLSFLITAFIANAQVDLEVVVYGLSDGSPQVNITVVLENESIGLRLTKATNKQAKATFRNLPVSGEYKVYTEANADYYEADTVDIIFRANENPSVALFAGAKSNTIELETVTVNYSGVSKINTIDAEVSAALTSAEIKSLPIEGRDITKALYRLPNVSQATGFFPEAPNVSVNGANSLFANYLIDGLDNNENFLGGQRFAIPVGFVENITVLSNNYSPEFGLTSNGVFNITTKSGSNEFKGEAFYVVRPGAIIDSSSPFLQRDLSGNNIKDGFQRHQFGVGFGGAIKKDKTFYYVNLEKTIDTKDNLLNVPELGVNETIRGNNEFTYLSGKVDHNWTDRLRTSFRSNFGFIGIERQGGGLEGGSTFASAGNTQKRNSINLALNTAYNAENFRSETNLLYGRFRWNYADPENPNSPNVNVLDPNDFSIATLGHPGFLFDVTEHTFQFQEKLTFYKGNHTIKTGIALKSSNFSLFGGGNPNGSYTVRLNQAQLNNLSGIGAGLSINDIPSDVEVLNYSVELRSKAFDKTQNIYSLYVEDQISVSNKLNVNFGLRYDYDNLSVGGSEQGDFNNIAPRASFNYKLSPNSIVRGGYGLFYDKVLYALYSDALQFNSNSLDYKAQLQSLINQGILPSDTDLDKITNEGNLSGNFANATYLNGPSGASLQGQREDIFSNELRILNPNGYDNPYSHQFTMGYQYQITKTSLFSVDLIHNRSENLFRLRNLNSPTAYDVRDNNGQVRSADVADLTRPVPIFNDLTGSYANVNGQRLDGVARNIIVTESAGKSRYYAATFNFQKNKGDSPFAYRLIYTLSSLKNDTDDINFRAEDANDFESEFAPSINDRRHIVNSFFTYHASDKLQFNLAALIQSGQPINRIPDAAIFGTTDLNGDGRAFGDAYVGNSDRQPGESRNSDRLPGVYTLDFAAQYAWSLGENSMTLRTDVFNATNRVNLSGYSNNATQSNQIQVGPAGSGIVRRNSGAPRQFQFSLNYIF